MATQSISRHFGTARHRLHLSLALAVPCLIGVSLALSAAVIGSSYSTPTAGSNSAITEQIQRELSNKDAFSKITRSVDVTVSDRQVQLEGRVSDYDESKRVAAMAAQLAPGREIKNNLRIESNATSEKTNYKGQQ